MCGSVGGLDAILEHSNFLNIISLGTEPPTPTPCRKLKKIPMTPPGKNVPSLHMIISK